jgi:Ca-activated chloride channel homolog
MVAPSGTIRWDLTTEPHRRTRSIRLALLIGLALAVAQTTPSGRQFTSGVNVVEVYTSVTDKAGKPVTGLGREAFTVRENGEPQQISTFAAGEFPLSVAVAIDRSFSMAGDRLASAKSGARIFLGGLRATDESLLIAVGSTTDTLAPLSTNRREQLDALAGLDAFGTTGLYDSIVAAIEAIQPARGRRALILLSDGDDRYSKTTSAEVLERARASDVLIYPIALGRTRPQAFAELATLTGGRSFHVRDAGRQLPDTLQTIAAELRNQYLIGYSPAKPPVAGNEEWRSITVTVSRPDVTVRARDGYLVR